MSVLSRPDIALHKSNTMKTTDESKYVKRTQKDYSMSFKLQVVQEIERGEIGLRESCRKYGIQSHSTVRSWLDKFGNFDWVNQSPIRMPKSKDHQILELEQKVKVLEKQKAFLEAQADRSDRKAVLFDIAEKEFNIPIRKKCSPEQSIAAAKKEKKQ